MEVTPDLVRQLAHLSRLELQPKEFERMIPELQKLLSYFESLGELDLDDFDELVRPIAGGNVLRTDVPAPGLEQDGALALAPERKNGFFKLPRVVEEGR